MLCFGKIVLCFANTGLCFDDIVLCFDNSLLSSDNTMLCLEKCLLCFKNCLLCLQIWATVKTSSSNHEMESRSNIKRLTVLMDYNFTPGCLHEKTRTGASFIPT